MQRLVHYWLLRAGVRLKHPRHMAQITQRPDKEADEGRVVERTEMLPAELFCSALVHYPSKTRTDGPATLDRIVALLSQAPFVAVVEVHPEPPQSDQGSKRVFVSAASLLRVKKAKGLAPAAGKSGGMAAAGDGREYSAASALKNDFNDSESEGFSDSGDEL